jgi:hypothetical protein
MIDVEKVIPGGIVCLYNAWSYYNLTTTVPPEFCIAIEAKKKSISYYPTSDKTVLLEERKSSVWHYTGRNFRT